MLVDSIKEALFSWHYTKEYGVGRMTRTTDSYSISCHEHSENWWEILIYIGKIEYHSSHQVTLEALPFFAESLAEELLALVQPFLEKH